MVPNRRRRLFSAKRRVDLLVFPLTRWSTASVTAGGRDQEHSGSFLKAFLPPFLAWLGLIKAFC